MGSLCQLMTISKCPPGWGRHLMWCSGGEIFAVRADTAATIEFERDQLERRLVVVLQSNGQPAVAQRLTIPPGGLTLEKLGLVFIPRSFEWVVFPREAHHLPRVLLEICRRPDPKPHDGGPLPVA